MAWIDSCAMQRRVQAALDCHALPLELIRRIKRAYVRFCRKLTPFNPTAALGPPNCIRNSVLQPTLDRPPNFNRAFTEELPDSGKS